MRRIGAFIVLAAICTAAPAATAGDRHDHHSVIVTTSWVRERLKDPRLVLELPDPSALDSTLEARGVTDSSIIVIYPGNA